MILLTDASPNDSRRIPPTAENPLGCAYEDAAGVTDTAAQVRTLQRQGVRVSAVFMGEDSSAGAATQIYGKNMARIRGMDQLAPRCRAIDPERDSGAWRLKNIK